MFLFLRALIESELLDQVPRNSIKRSTYIDVESDLTESISLLCSKESFQRLDVYQRRFPALLAKCAGMHSGGYAPSVNSLKYADSGIFRNNNIIAPVKRCSIVRLFMIR